MHKYHFLLKVAQIATLSTTATLGISAFAESPPLPIGQCPEGTQTIAKFDNPDVGNNWGYRYPEAGELVNIVKVTGSNWTSEAPITQIVCKGEIYTVLSDGKSGELPAACAGTTYSKLQFCGSVAAIPQCNDWKFAKDSFEDGTTGRNFYQKADGSWAHSSVAGRNVNSPRYWLAADDINESEIYAIAIKETMTVYAKEDDPAPSREGQIMVAFNTNTPLKGNDMSWLPDFLTENWTDKYSGLGDLVLEFDGVKYAVHFTNNDAGVTEIGVYKDISLKDVTLKNWGWRSLSNYMEAVKKITGKDASCGDISCSDLPGYGTNRYGQMVINKGTWIADIKFLGKSELPDFAAGLGVDASQLGQYTYGFKFSKEATGIGKTEVGEVKASIFMECFNDGVVLKTALGCDCVAQDEGGLKKSTLGCELLGEGVNNLVAVATDEGIALNWEIEPGNGLLNVYRAEKSAEGQYINITKVASGLAGSATAYTDAVTKAGTYYYSVEQVSLDGKSLFSQVASVTIAE